MRSYKNTLLLLMGLASSVSHAETISDALPEGYQFRGLDFIYDPVQCGDVGFTLDPENGDCTVEFDKFFLAESGERICDLTIVVDLPPGLAIAPSRLLIEGDYQVGSESAITLRADYGLQGGDKVDIWEKWQSTDDSINADTFISESWYAERTFSDCGGQAVFEGTFVLTSDQPGDVSGIIDIGRTDLGLDLTEKPLSYWGWDYKICD